MTDTHQLPEPELGYIKTDKSNQPAFSARQMREMKDTNQLPPMPTPKFTETIRGVPCITVTEHEHLIRAYALQARAQVQGDPSWWMRETDEGAEWTDTAPLVPSGWTPLYTAPQPAQATQAEVTMTDADTVQVYGVKDGVQTLIGSAPMPPRMKARELAREQFGHFEDGDGSDAELCFGALEQLIDHMERSAHRAALSHQPVPVAWLRSSDLADLRTCNYRHIGADSPAIWAPNDVSTPSPDMGLIPVYAHPAPSDDVVRDAARYRWLKDRDNKAQIGVGHWESDDHFTWLCDLDADAAIDAAMLAANEGGA